MDKEAPSEKTSEELAKSAITQDEIMKKTIEQLAEDAEGLIGHSSASNNWAISGKHTLNGMPMLSTDPHLSSTIPAFW